MRVQLDYQEKPIVKLVDFIFGYDDWHLLNHLIAHKPNFPIRYVGERGKDTFIPAHKILAEDFNVLKMLNP